MSSKTQSNVDNKLKYSKPNMYAVIMYNDDYTTMDFVIEILIKFYKKTQEQAQSTMLEVHRKGKSVVGIYPYDIAITKTIQAERHAEEKEFPLKIIIEIA